MKRILEKIDSDGISRFIPQKKILFWWFSYEGYPAGEVKFDSLEECKKWLLYERTAIVLVHNLTPS